MATTNVLGNKLINYVFLTGRSNLDDVIFCSKRVLNAQLAFGIVTPFSVDNEAVMVCAWVKWDRRAPDAVMMLAKRNRSLQPSSEIPGQ